VSNQYRYKAFISYSHRDEKGASWLHRALESYRLPRKLVGSKTGAGEVPSRIRPVFRDRDDLSSSSDLGDTVKQALSDSENLIVVCSPDAAASPWVNEEIRHFASLGRQNQIFCVIVDGEPASAGTLSTCFPAALAEIGLQEPLAADIRKWADGKHLSKLKLVSGILGLPLDQLRRRDLQKRQKVWALAAIASIAIAAILIAAITSRIAAEQRRDSGESLVAYKLNELRTMLNVTDDPENLTRLDQWNRQDLDSLIANAGTGEDSLVLSALELRGQGNDFYQKSAFDEALEQFQQSWLLLAENYRRDRSKLMTFFELGQAEFYIGLVYIELGEMDKAQMAFMAYAEITRRLIVLQPENAEWVLEMAYALTNLGGLEKKVVNSKPERTLQLMQSALEYNQIALVLDPQNQHYRSELGQSQAFLADAQRGVCDLEGALQSRQKHVALETEILMEDSENTAKMQRLAWALSGYYTVLSETGQHDVAIENLEKLLLVMAPVVLEKPGVQRTERFMLSRQYNLLKLKALVAGTDPAQEDLEDLEAGWQDYFQNGATASSSTEEYAAFLLGRAQLAKSIGASNEAEGFLEDAFDYLVNILKILPANREAENVLMLAVFQRWEIEQQIPSETILKELPYYSASKERTRACYDASLAVRQAIMQGNIVQTRELSEFLLESGYREADFMRICKQYSLCQGQQ